MWLSMDSRRLGVRRNFQKEQGTSRWGPSVPSVPEPSHPQSVRREEMEAGLGGGMDHGRVGHHHPRTSKGSSGAGMGLGSPCWGLEASEQEKLVVGGGIPRF